MKKMFFALVFLSGFAHANVKQINLQMSPFKLAPLPYAENSLEKAIDEETMKIHHGKHHRAYVDNLNKALGDQKVSLIDLITNASSATPTVRNNAGGHWNHTFFWSILSGKESDNKIPTRLEKEIVSKWGSLDKFKEEFERAGAGQFGSGWVWLIRTSDGLKITATPNQDNPLMDVVTLRGWPVLGADIWEHAYYLKYQNRRAEYLKGFWSVVNWKMVDELNQEAIKSKLP